MLIPAGVFVGLVVVVAALVVGVFSLTLSLRAVADRALSEADDAQTRCDALSLALGKRGREIDDLRARFDAPRVVAPKAAGPYRGCGCSCHGGRS